MSNFGTLVRFEYKKILLRKNIIISFIAVICLIVVFSTGAINSQKGAYWEEAVSSFKAMQQEKQIIHSKAGYITSEMVNETIQQNGKMRLNGDNYIENEYGSFPKSNAYITYNLPYRNIINLIDITFVNDSSDISTDGLQNFNLSKARPIDTLPISDSALFYQKISQKAQENVYSETHLSSNVIKKNIQMLSSLKTPFYNDYYGAYYAFFSFFKLMTLVLLTIIAIAISPIFSNECERKTDHLILASKHGKKLLVLAKLFTGATFSIILSIIVLGGFFLVQLAVYGGYGWNCPLQLINSFSPYAVTMLQAVLILIIVSTLIATIFSLIIMFMSACSKASFAVVIASFVLLFVPALFYADSANKLIYQVCKLFPAQATTMENIFSINFFEVCGNVFTPPVFYTMFCIVSCFVLLPIIFYCARNQQVS